MAQFRGSTLYQSGGRNADSNLLKKLEKQGRFDKILKTNVDLKKINMDVLRAWVDGRVIQALGQEDDVVVGLVIGWVETAVEEAPSEKKPADPRLLQVQLTGFLEKAAGPFMADLWSFCIDAAGNPGGVPTSVLKEKRRQDEIAAENERSRIEKLKNLENSGGKPKPSRFGVRVQQSSSHRVENSNRRQDDQQQNGRQHSRSQSSERGRSSRPRSTGQDAADTHQTPERGEGNDRTNHVERSGRIRRDPFFCRARNQSYSERRNARRDRYYLERRFHKRRGRSYSRSRSSSVSRRDRKSRWKEDRSPGRSRRGRSRSHSHSRRDRSRSHSRRDRKSKRKGRSHSPSRRDRKFRRKGDHSHTRRDRSRSRSHTRRGHKSERKGRSHCPSRKDGNPKQNSLRRNRSHSRTPPSSKRPSRSHSHSSNDNQPTQIPRSHSPNHSHRKRNNEQYDSDIITDMHHKSNDSDSSPSRTRIRKCSNSSSLDEK